jgi:hypothetical protein
MSTTCTEVRLDRLATARGRWGMVTALTDDHVRLLHPDGETVYQRWEVDPR